MSHPSSIEGSKTTEALQPVPNAHVYSFISCTINSADTMAIDENVKATLGSRTELDSRANMVVIGNGAVILNHSGCFAQVSPFTPDYKALTEGPIINAVLLYKCPYTNDLYIMVFHNALSVPAMDHNLILPFIMREAGVKVYETPKIQVPDPTDKDCSLYFPYHKLRVPLTLWGYFLTSSQDDQQMPSWKSAMCFS